ncbi:MAG: alpha/beta hydrolase [Maribacter sp.]|nr:MAG: alpha/beta hydrolase [Maribacter sp.]
MGKITLIVFAFFTISPIFGQDATGHWYGVLEVQGTQLRLVFNISRADNIYSATMDSPDQGVKGVPVTSISYEKDTLKLEISNAGIGYEGTLGKDAIFTGTFKQGGHEFPMDLSRNAIGKRKLKRPQEPTEPYPYYTEEVAFQNDKANISLAGTLSLPKKEGNFPVVVLISGSGPQNRDEELLGHKPFLVISDYLTRNGIGVLRYDDRGVGESEGDFRTSTTADFVTDVESAILYLKTRKEIDKNEIGLIGHSEGGIIAPIVAGKSKDVAFVILLAGTGIQGDQLLLLQQQSIGKASGLGNGELQQMELINRRAFDIVKKSKGLEQLKIDLTNYFKQTLADNPNAEKPEGMSDDGFVELQVGQIANPWMQYFIKHDPAPVLEKVECPVLALNGAKDLQVPAKINLKAIKDALEKSGNKDVTTKELSGLNHLFQECETGLPTEYAVIEQTFSPKALTEISNWILNALK